MDKKQKTIYLSILGFILFINLVVRNEHIIEANTNKEKNNNNDDDNDLCLKAALLAQKNNHMLEKIKNKYENLFNKKMKTLENKCANAGKALYMSKDPHKHMKK